MTSARAARSPHADDAAVFAHQGAASERPDVLPDGRLLRAVLRGRRARGTASQHHADRARHLGGVAGQDGRSAGRFGRAVPVSTGQARRERGDLRTDRRGDRRQGTGRAAGRAHRHARYADRHRSAARPFRRAAACGRRSAAAGRELRTRLADSGFGRTARDIGAELCARLRARSDRAVRGTCSGCLGGHAWPRAATGRRGSAAPSRLALRRGARRRRPARGTAGGHARSLRCRRCTRTAGRRGSAARLRALDPGRPPAAHCGTEARGEFRLHRARPRHAPQS